MLILPVFSFPPPVKHAAFAQKQHRSPSHSLACNFTSPVIFLQVNNQQFFFSAASLLTFWPPHPLRLYERFVFLFKTVSIWTFCKATVAWGEVSFCFAVFEARWLANSRCRLATRVPGVFHRKFPLISAGDNGATMSRAPYCRKEGKRGAK